MDGAMPALSRAIDVRIAECAIARVLGLTLRIHRAQLVRHKPGRRFMVRYDVEVDDRLVRWMGKGRAKGIDERSFELQSRLFDDLFGDGAADFIHVPRPIGCVPELGMWLQEAVPGTVLTEMLETPRGPELCARAAQAAHKLHHAGIAPAKSHGIADELSILHQRLEAVAQAQPRLAIQIDRLLQLCDRAGGTLAGPVATGIHRDFYPGQLLVDRDHLYLIDFDLYCAGDPMLDFGNFLAHLTEYALRRTGDAGLLEPCERAMAQWIASHHDQIDVQRLSTWRILSLARHVHLSTLFSDRGHVTETILSQCVDDLQWINKH